MGQLSSLFSAHLWYARLNAAAMGLLLAIPVALLFEVAGWLARGWLLRRLAPAFNRDAGRDPASRARRRRQLRDNVIACSRLVQNGAALITIFTLWHLDPVAVGLVLVAVVVAVKAPLRDAVASWSLLVDDVLAPGDQVCLNSGPKGTVAECGPRRIKLTDDQGRAWWIRCSEVVVVQHLAMPASSVGADKQGVGNG